ncbi:MAG: AAA family ATPase [Pikeienuella sp.]
MPRIDTWLADIGLEKYITVFEDAEIDFDVLSELVEDDLKELDLPLGPRRKIWGAISRLAHSKAKEKNNLNAPSANQDVPAERRHLTVMFVDLVGSTALSTRLDAEDMRKLIAEFQSEIAFVVDEFNGFVAQFLGDGVMCYFGWPHASEDDTQRAVRAGLKIIDTIKRQSAPDGEALAVRVGVATGVVIVGDLMMKGAAQEAAAVGETTNLAARLQGVAGPNRLVVSSNARSLLGAAFELESIGKQQLKGIGSAVEAFIVSSETAVESRFAARRPVALTPIVGRDREIGQVLRRWSLAQSGQGQMILLRGEAGIGKSRVVQTITDAIASDSHSRVTYQCSPYHTESAFYPFTRQISYTAGFAADDTAEQRIAKMEASIIGDNKTRARMALLLGIDGTDRYGEIDETPAQQRLQMMQALLKQLVARSENEPLLLVFEDLHWIDPTSLELLELVLKALPEQKIMVLATARPSFDHDFVDCPSVVEVMLKRLDPKMTFTIASKMAGGKTLPEEIVDIIARRTDGVPLFVEELTKSILESGSLQEDGDSYVVKGAVSDIAIPATLHDSLMARLDRLGPIKEIAQIAACMGREFSHRLIAQVSDLPGRRLENALEQLLAAELIHRHGTEPLISYSFKHALVRDAAYDGLLKERRILFHRRILSALETEPDAAPELLATHAETAQLTDRAIELWEAAGKAAIGRPAFKEAEAHLRRAILLNAIRIDAGDKGAISAGVALRVQLFVALSPGIGLWADETVAVLEEALALADKAGESPFKADIVYGLVLSSYFRGSLKDCLARSHDLVDLAYESGDVAQLVIAKRMTGIVQLTMGRFSDANLYLTEAAELCDQIADLDLAARFGHDPIVALKIYQSLNVTFQGKTVLGDAFRQTAENRAQDIAHTNTSAAMLGLALIRDQVANDVEAEKVHLGILQNLVKEHGITASHLWAEVAAALLQLAEGDLEGAASYREAEATMLAANVRLLVSGSRVLAARRALAIGLVNDAREFASGVLPMMNATGEKSWLAEYHRLCATFAIREENYTVAEAELKTAIECARKCCGALWELRAAIDLARLYAQLDRKQDAIATISPIYEKIGKGDCLKEMAAASELIDELNTV